MRGWVRVHIDELLAGVMALGFLALMLVTAAQLGQ